MSAGHEANHSGQFLEGIVEREFMTRGFHFRNHGNDKDNLDLFAPRVVVRRAPYESIYESESHSEFVITDGNRKVRIECRWQESHGSVDEKFPYLLRNAIECMPEPEILILLGGNGARDSAIRWLRREAQKCQMKKIYVLTVNEFPRWVRDNFVGREAA